mgnify:CR=1 FL=1
MRSDSKLNRLQQELPEGLLADAAWMEAHGYSSALRSQYVSAGWLESPARRVYRRSRMPLTWQQVVMSLQTVLDYPLLVGGRTALELQGYAHYLSGEVREVHLYGPIRPPTWLANLPLAAEFRWHNSQRLFPDHVVPERDVHRLVPGLAASSLPASVIVSANQYTNLPVSASTKERAVLELLDELPDHESFQQVDALMEGMSDLSPRRLQALLEACASVKVKRLFLFFADRHRHAWRARVDNSRVDLGSGKRVLVKGGKLDPRYNITVPADLGGQ